MTDCKDACGATESFANAPATETSFGFTRRNLLRSVATGLSAIGLTFAADAALAATKKVTVCKTTDIAVGSGRRFTPKGGTTILVVQPKKGVFRAFDAYCTHQRILLNGIDGTNLVCTDGHGAMFNMDSGKVTQGPARTALKKYTVTLSGTSVQVTF
jgi:nitrite reductase/ring-hydroxylating ferredoxin subunit